MYILSVTSFFFIDCFSQCNLFEKNTAIYSRAFKFADSIFIDDTSYESYSEVLFSFKQYILFCKIGNCSKGVGKEKLIGKSAQLFKSNRFQLN